MKKLARNISILLIALLLACCLIVGFTACGDDSSSSGSGSGSGTEDGTDMGNDEYEDDDDTDTSSWTVVSDGKFEAEYTSFMDNRFGTRAYQGYSMTGFNPYLVCTDASNGGAVGNLYVNEAYIYFRINCSAATTATLYLSLSVEAECMRSTSDTSITFSQSQFKTYVNPDEIGGRGYVTHDAFTLDVQGMSDIGYHKAFAEYSVGEIELEEGINYIVLQTGNTRKGQGGTMSNIAPIVDYIRLEDVSTDATLSWDPVTTNASTQTSKLFS